MDREGAKRETCRPQRAQGQRSLAKSRPLPPGWLIPGLLSPYDRLLSEKCCHQILIIGASLVAQQLRVRLPMQGTRVRALVREDPTCRGATKSLRHNYWACTLEPTSHNYWACVLQLLRPTRIEPLLHNERSHHSEKPVHCSRECPPLATAKVWVQQRRPNTAKNK